MVGPWAVSRGLLGLKQGFVSHELCLLRDDAVSAGYQLLGSVDQSVLLVIGACVREPTRDLVIFTLGGERSGDVIVYSLRGELVRSLPHLIPRAKIRYVRWSAAWRTTLAICSDSPGRTSFVTIVQFD